MLNKGVFYSLRFCAVFYLIITVMMFIMGVSVGSLLLTIMVVLFIGALMYLFYRASEEAKIGSHLGRILTGVCAALFLISFLMGNGAGMKWLGLLASAYWSYAVIYWEYD